MTRREQWIQFYTAALNGLCAYPVDAEKEAVADSAAEIADAAMGRLDARDFPEPKVQALLLTARNVWKAAEHGAQRGAYVPDHLLATLGAAIRDMEAGE